MAKLGDICIIQSGGTPSRGNKEYWENGTIPWVKISDFSGKYLDQTSEKITQAGLEGSSAKIFTKGTILYTIFATLGETCILDIDATTNQAIAGLKLNDDSVLLDYLYYYLLSKKEYVNEIGRGVAQNNINMKILREMEIAIPPKEEQNRITDVLNKVYELIALRKEQLAKLDQLVKSRFIELFGDPVVNSMSWAEELIGDSCFVTKLAGFEYTQYIHYEDSGDVVMVKAQNVKNGKLNRKDLSYISNEVSNSLPRSQLAVGDVVMTYVGANIGDVAVIDNEYKYHLAPNVAKIRPNAEKYNSIYFMYMLMFLNSYIVGNSADTAKAALGMERIRKLKVFVPPIELQNQFAAFVEQTDKSKLAIQQNLDKLELLKKSLMQEYFG